MPHAALPDGSPCPWPGSSDQDEMASSDPCTDETRCRALTQHLHGEWTVCKKVGLRFLTAFALGSYLFCIVFRRTSFYMQRYGMESGTVGAGPLYDVGQEVTMKLFGLPDMAVPDPDPVVRQQHIEQVLVIIGWTDTFMGTISAITFIVPFASWYAAWAHNQIPKRAVYFMNYLNRYYYTLVLGQLMRCVSYLMTVVPGPSYHCRPGFIEPETGVSYMELMPKTVMSIFIPHTKDLTLISMNCGDLMFSGHMYTNVLSYYFFVSYSKRIFTEGGTGLLSKRTRQIIIAIDTLCLIGLVLCILASRQHYTVDLVIATYMGMLLPYWADDHFVPAEVDPYNGEAAEPLVPTPTPLVASPVHQSCVGMGMAAATPPPAAAVAPHPGGMNAALCTDGQAL